VGASSALRFEIQVAPSSCPDDASAIPTRGATRIRAQDGQTLLRALQAANAPILSVCGGQASCGACRVRIETDDLADLTPAGRVEGALLDCLDDPLPGHRLACQVVLTPALSGLRLTLAP